MVIASAAPKIPIHQIELSGGTAILSFFIMMF
jgi:hypothetical protein